MQPLWCFACIVASSINELKIVASQKIVATSQLVLHAQSPSQLQFKENRVLYNKVLYNVLI